MFPLDDVIMRHSDKFSMTITTAYKVKTIESNPPNNSAGLAFSDTEIVKELLNKEKIWSCYSITKSVRDGHCLIYSVVESFNSQLDRREPITISKLIKMIRFETLKNIENYSQFFRDSSRDDLIHFMNLYLCNKIYNARYGDLVPLVIANALHVNVLIISEGTQGFSTEVVYTNAGNDDMGEIFI